MKGESPFTSGLPDSEGPIVLAIVGPNGSGKSSIANLLNLTNVHVGDPRFKGRIVIDEETDEVLAPIVNPDEIAKRIQRDRPEISWDECNRLAAEEAGEMREMLLEAGFDFVFETVGSHPSKVQFLKDAKALGYCVAVLFVTTEDAEINVGRVKERHQQGGHDVPVDKVRARYGRCMALLPQYYNVADYLVIFDNSEERETTDGKGPKRLLVKEGNKVTVTDQGRASSWLFEGLGVRIS